MMDHLTFLLHIGLSVAVIVLLRTVLCSRSAPLPPGPRGLPFLGNLLDMPKAQEWLTFTKWGKKWGDVVSVTMLGQTIIILNSAEVATDMLEKQGAIYSDRPRIEMGGELVGWKFSLPLLPYGDRVRMYRKLFHQSIGSQALMSKYHPGAEQETHRFLRRILENSDEFAAHIEKSASAFILRISYGYEVKEKNDPFVMIVAMAAEQFALSTAPGGFLVNLIPVLRYIPSWIPGAGFKTVASEWAKTINQMVDGPFQFTKRQMASGAADISFSSQLLAEPGLTKDKEFDIKWSAASFYLGGVDTTVASIKAFFLAMVLYPDVMQKAQEEIDTVIGSDRLPSFSDRPNLPYINALVHEVFRWHNISPIPLPHRATEDNIYNGYLIPKGSLVIPNIWNMMHDADIYADPFAFEPERFLKASPEPHPNPIAFGFGRRICPGSILADASIFISVAMSLAVFKIAAEEKDSVPIIPIHKQMTGTISHPEPFRCTITPRSSKAIELILDYHEV